MTIMIDPIPPLKADRSIDPPPKSKTGNRTNARRRIGQGKKEGAAGVAARDRQPIQRISTWARRPAPAQARAKRGRQAGSSSHGAGTGKEKTTRGGGKGRGEPAGGGACGHRRRFARGLRGGAGLVVGPGGGGAPGRWVLGPP